jgi:AraC family transcriptional regulator of adaptative response/methylated-DNA-[protein]-cysteine methyltransferase
LVERDALPRLEHLQMIREACHRMKRADHPPSLGDLAAVVGLSPSYFQRMFLQWVSVTPREYAAAWQRERLVLALGRGLPVLEAIYAAGYGSTSRVYGRLEHLLGMTPAQVRKGAPGISIRYAVTPCQGAWLLVATTHRGLCALELGSSPVELLEDLAARFPRAQLGDGSAAMAVGVALLANGLWPVPHGWLPTDIRRLALRQRMWSVLERTRIASIGSYADLDRVLPQLKSVIASLDNGGFGGPAANDAELEVRSKTEH